MSTSQVSRVTRSKRLLFSQTSKIPQDPSQLYLTKTYNHRVYNKRIKSFIHNHQYVQDNRKVIPIVFNMKKQVQFNERMKEQHSINKVKQNHLKSDEIIQILSQIVYQTNNQYAKQNFLQQIENHVYFKQYFPNSSSLTGVNLISDGIFHQLWAQIIKRQNEQYFYCIKNTYYEDYRYAIKNNIQQFQKAFLYDNQTKYIDAQSTQLFEQQINSTVYIQNYQILAQTINYEENIYQNNTITQDQNKLLTEDLTSSLNQIFDQNQPTQILNQEQLDKQNKSLQNQTSLVFTHIQEDDLYIPLNTKLLNFRQTNKNRRAAEMACKFFNIGPSRTFSIDEIQIQKILQIRREKNYEYAIILGKLIPYYKNNLLGKTIMHEDTLPSRIFITTYKFFNLQLFIRLQITYKYIYGFIAYNQQIDFYGFLQKFNDKKELEYQENSNKSRNQNSYQQMIKAKRV